MRLADQASRGQGSGECEQVFFHSRSLDCDLYWIPQMIWHLLSERNDLTQKLAFATMPRTRTRKVREDGDRRGQASMDTQPLPPAAAPTFLTEDQPDEVGELASKLQAVAFGGEMGGR